MKKVKMKDELKSSCSHPLCVGGFIDGEIDNGPSEVRCPDCSGGRGGMGGMGGVGDEKEVSSKNT